MELHEANDLLNPGYLPFESGYRDLSNGKRLVAALTRMPGCRAKMVHWWFSWLGGTDQYKLWHPTDHVFSDWENRRDGNYIGASFMNTWLVPVVLSTNSGSIFTSRRNCLIPTGTADPVRWRCARVSVT
jgi:DAPG hydrolase PhiG domain